MRTLLFPVLLLALFSIKGCKSANKSEEKALDSLNTTAQSRWSAEKANAWYANEPFLVGANYVPANAINELEMYQTESFDPKTIDKEMALAESIGMNTMRVFLHDLLWQDSTAFTKRLDQFLDICAKHNIRPMLVLFDSCWDPHPKLGKQHAPTPGTHNSGWLQSPGADALKDKSQYPRLEAYVKGVVGAFKDDKRILAWDIWNEPDNANDSSYGQNNLKTELPKQEKIDLVLNLLPQAFQWTRDAGATQPLTSGVWIYRTPADWQDSTKWSPMEKVQFDNSDIVTFHQYRSAKDLEAVIPALKTFGRPIICTEYMARGADSKFQTHLPIAKKEKIGMINWGFVAGKTQTYLPWDSWQKPYVNGRKPSIWFHEVFKQDGTPVDPAEIAAIKQATGK